MTSKYCEYCGSKKEKVSKPRTRGYSDFDEKTGKRIVDVFYVCFNKNCKEGRENICGLLQGGHTFPPEKIVILVIAAILIISPIILKGFGAGNASAIPLITFLILCIPGMIIFSIRECGRCSYSGSDYF